MIPRLSAAIVWASRLGVGLGWSVAAGAGSFDGTWHGSYEIIRDFGDFRCKGGDMVMEIGNGHVVIQTRNSRSDWTYVGTIHDTGALRAVGEISTDFKDPDDNQVITAEWTGQATGGRVSGALDILKYCEATWQAERTD